MAKIKLSNRKRNIVGSLVSSLRKSIRISQNELAGRIQLLGWDCIKMRSRKSSKERDQ